MLNLLTTPSLDTLAPMSPPVSPPMHDTATLPAQAATTTTTTTTTFAEPAAASTTSTWRPYHSHLARLVMSLPALGGVADQPKKTRKMSFSFGGSGETASDEKEFVLEGTVDVFADKMGFTVQPNIDGGAPFVRPVGSKSTSSGAARPISPPSSPEIRKKRLSFANILPSFGGGSKDKDASTDDSALDLEEHPDIGADGVRQLRMKSVDMGSNAAGNPTSAESHAMKQPEMGVPEERVHNEGDEAKWPLFVNGKPLAQVAVPLNQLTHSNLDLTLSKALSTTNAPSALAGTLNRTPATLTVHIPATEGVSSAMGGKDMYDGAVVMKIEFMSAFSGDTEAQTLHDIVLLALERLGIKSSADTDLGLKLTRTISRGLRRKSSAGASDDHTDAMKVVRAAEAEREKEERARDEMHRAMAMQ